ncbi:hypothetical protein NSA56_11440 [Oceanobacillus caeni]|uniref:hypothetical protein n=1 Tax=Oceanobacillus caeni TaxID=405946 RepID=UPI00214A7587|nr:hypothetical protein [Oceanobacillus caeni]MCR1835009.1 hypothetical protein [Oceanobacillus caeni]
MNKWRKDANEYKQYLAELEKWVPNNWEKLPEGVKRIIIRGQHSAEKRIKQWEEWAKEDELKNK